MSKSSLDSLLVGFLRQAVSLGLGLLYVRPSLEPLQINNLTRASSIAKLRSDFVRAQQNISASRTLNNIQDKVPSESVNKILDESFKSR